LRLLPDILFDNPAVEPKREALSFRDRRISYGELQDRVRGFAGSLQAGGIAKGDRVAVLLENCPEFIECFFAITAIGAVMVPLNYRLSLAEMTSILGDAQAGLLITEPRYSDVAALLRDGVDSLSRTLLVGDDYDAALAGPAPLQRPELVPNDTAALLYTSGTTSLPKGVILSHGNYLADYRNVAAVLGVNAQTVNLQLSPLYHAAAQHTYLQIFAGGRTVLLPKFDPGHALALIEDEKVNYLFIVPTMLYNILDHPDIDVRDISSVRTISYGAAPMTEARRREAIARFGHIFLHAYGLTECTAHASILDKVAHQSRGGSIGRGLLHSQIAVIDDDGQPVPAGGIGEIRVRGPQVAAGYWRRPDASANAFVDGWLHTGDIGSWDEDGFVQVIDRKKDIIISGGANIHPKDIEEVLASHPQVAEVAVYGVPHDNWGEAVEAAVVTKNGAEVPAQELIALARDQLAHFKTPRTIRFLSELPRNPSGKILKRALRQQATVTP
jgi:acyl-CoA synthetase (AMP-forming)/AMP-acid ligase II